MDEHYDDDDRDAGWGFTQVALASRSPLQQLSGNVSPLHSRPGEKAHAVSQPIVVYDVSDGEDEEQEPEAEAAEALPCITQLYDEEEEAPCLVEDEGDAAPGDVPDGDAAAPDFCDVVAPSDSDFTPVRTALDVLQLGHHAPDLRASNVTWHTFQHADETELASWGLPLGARLRVLSAMEAARHGQPPWRVAGQAVSELHKEHRIPALAHGPERPIFEYFGGSKPPAPPPRLPPRPAPKVRAGGQPGNKAQQPPRRFGTMPPWHAVPGTRFIVDGFAPRVACLARPETSAWFLTHFHSDHYSGLGARWSRGPVYCTAITAALCRLRLHVPASVLHVLPLNERIVVDGVACTLFDANHCPGAAMILFEPPEPEPPVLHTGDCRWSTALHGPMLGPILAAMAPQRRADLRLVLDTTYCDPAAAFPPSSEAVAFIANAVRSEGFNVSRTLFLVGSYTIGKERCAFAAARAAGVRLYAGNTKRAVLDCLAPTGRGVGTSGLSPADMAMLTNDDGATNVHIVPMACVSFARMKGILSHYRGRFDTCVGFAPSGWAFGRAAAAVGGSARRRQGALVRYDVPYSEHSSFQELRDCVAFLRPAAVCPSVNNDMGERCAHMVDLLTAHEGDPRLQPTKEAPLRKPQQQWRANKRKKDAR